MNALFVFFTAAGSRLVLYALFPSVLYQGGGNYSDYVRAAKSLLSGDGFGAAYMTPVVPIVFAAAFFIFGEGLLTMLFLQAVAAGAVSVGVYYLSFFLFREKKAAFAAGILAALWPNFLTASFPYGDHLFIYAAIFVWAIYFFVQGIFKGNARHSLVGGALFGIGALTEPIAVYFPIFLVVWVAALYGLKFFNFGFAFLPEAPFMRNTVAVAAMVLAFGAIVLPWTYRNVQVFGGIAEAPLIVKHEQLYIKPEKVAGFAQVFVEPRTVMLTMGLGEMFFEPYNLFLLDLGSESYKAFARSIVRREASIAFTDSRLFILGVKGLVGAANVLLILLSIAAIIRCRARGFFLLVPLLLGYTVFAAIGFGAYNRYDFEAVSPLSAFFMHFVPLLITLSAPLWAAAIRRSALIFRRSSSA